MRVTIIEKDKENGNLPIGTFFLLFLGIILTFNSEGFLSFLFIILGACLLLYGIYKFIRYFKVKQQFHYDDNVMMVSAVGSCTIGLLTILLASFITNAISILTGIWLIFAGINKLSTATLYKINQPKFYVVELVSAILFVSLGVYSIFADNGILMALGIILIVYAISDLIRYFISKKK